MFGQENDKGANRRGKHNGLLKKLLVINPGAFFVPCTAHSLNLVVNDAANINNNIPDFLFLFKNNMPVLNVFDLNVKLLSDKRWSIRIGAIKPLRYQIGQVML